MQIESTATSRWNTGLILAVVMAMLAGWVVMTGRAGAAPAEPVTAQPGNQLGGMLVGEITDTPTGVIFAKYDGIDGESVSKDYEGWIDVAAFSWGAHATGSTVRGVGATAPVVEDFVLTFTYKKATPKLAEKLLTGEIIPKLEIELVRSGEEALTYLRYELTNVQLTDYIVAGEEGGGNPGVSFVHSFDKIEVTYTSHKDDGSPEGQVGYEYSISENR